MDVEVNLHEMGFLLTYLKTLYFYNAHGRLWLSLIHIQH